MKAYRQGRDADAERLLKLAVKEAEGFGDKDSRLARSLHNLAMVYLAQENYAQAEPLVKRALEIKEKISDLNPADLAATLNNLGVICFSLGNYSDAESNYKRVLAIDEKDLAANHPEKIISLENYGLLLKKQGRYSEADQMNARAAALRSQPTR